MKIRSAAVNLLSDLSSLLRMGMPVHQALRFLSRDEAPPATRRIAEETASRVESGESFASASRAWLPKSLYAFVASGERAEALPTVMADLSRFISETERVRLQARDAMLYPAALLFTCVITALVMEHSLGIFGTTQPSDSLMQGLRLGAWFLLGAATTGLILLLLILTPRGEHLRWRLPYARTIARDLSLIGTCRIIALALNAALPLPEAVDLAAAAEQNDVLKNRLQRIAADLRAGLSLSMALRLDDAFPASLADAIASAEGAEDLPNGLSVIAAQYEAVLSHRIATALTWLEPALIMGVGGVCAVIAITFWHFMYAWALTL